MLVGGSAKIKLDDEVIEPGPWDAIRVSAETTRGFEAGPEGGEYTAFGTPNTENRDAEPAPPDWWTDASLWFQVPVL